MLSVSPGYLKKTSVCECHFLINFLCRIKDYLKKTIRNASIFCISILYITFIQGLKLCEI